MRDYYEFRNADGYFTIERSTTRGQRGSTAWTALYEEELVLAQGQDPAEVLEKLLSGECARLPSGRNPADCRLPREFSLWQPVSR